MPARHAGQDDILFFQWKARSQSAVVNNHLTLMLHGKVADIDDINGGVNGIRYSIKINKKVVYHRSSKKKDFFFFLSELMGSFSHFVTSQRLQRV